MSVRTGKRRDFTQIRRAAEESFYRLRGRHMLDGLG
jgi:hypothetical protein